MYRKLYNLKCDKNLVKKLLDYYGIDECDAKVTKAKNVQITLDVDWLLNKLIDLDKLNLDNTKSVNKLTVDEKLHIEEQKYKSIGKRICID